MLLLILKLASFCHRAGFEIESQAQARFALTVNDPSSILCLGSGLSYSYFRYPSEMSLDLGSGIYL